LRLCVICETLEEQLVVRSFCVDRRETVAGDGLAEVIACL